MMKSLAARNIDAKEEHPRTRIPNKVMYKLIVEEARRHPSINGMVATACLMDEPRTLALMDIVTELTREGASALELGAGCGPLTFAFLNAGGLSVVAVEKSSRLCKVIQNCAQIFGFEDQLIIHNNDVFEPRLRLKGKFDFILAELISTGLLSEPMVAAMKRIRPNTTEDTLFIPEQAVSTIALCDHRAFPISGAVRYDHVDMRSVEKDGVNTEVTLKVRMEDCSATATYAELNTYLIYPDGRVTSEFLSLCNRTNAEITDDDSRLDQFKVKNGQRITLRITYTYGEERPMIQRIL